MTNPNDGLRGLTPEERIALDVIHRYLVWSEISAEAATAYNTIRAALSRLPADAGAVATEPVVYCVHGRLGLGYTTDRDTIEGLAQKLASMHGDDADDYTATPLYAHPPAVSPMRLADALCDVVDEIPGDEPDGNLAALALRQARERVAAPPSPPVASEPIVTPEIMAGIEAGSVDALGELLDRGGARWTPPADDAREAARETTADEMPMSLQEHVELLRMQHRTLRAAAKATGVDHAYLHRLIKGEKVNPSDDVLRRLGLERRIAYVGVAAMTADQAKGETT